MGKPLRTHGGAIGGVLHSRSKEPPRRAQRLFLRRLQAIHGAGSFGGQSRSIGREPLGPASRAEGERQEGHSRVREPWRAPGLVDLSSFIYKSWERIQRRPGRRVSRYPSPVHETAWHCAFSASPCVCPPDVQMAGSPSPWRPTVGCMAQTATACLNARGAVRPGGVSWRHCAPPTAASRTVPSSLRSWLWPATSLRSLSASASWMRC